MEDFSITVKLTTKDYAKAMFIGLYKQPVFILSACLGLYLLITAILDGLNVIAFYAETPWFEIICGPFLLLFPTLIVLLSVKQVLSNRSFQQGIKYTFGENGIKVEGLTFKSEFQWAHIIKQKELGRYLILYHAKKYGNFIDKNKLTPVQLQFIKAKVGKK